MGRPPCCEKVGIKKGPWTPEEDITLVSYIQQHGPGNWRSVPTNTGLLRCSKSCRLRWTNYLRPGIKRGNFTPNEEGMIIHLQALLGNKWAAIASYLPQRTDNDIKNYWNTHLKKKINKFPPSEHANNIFSNDKRNDNYINIPITCDHHASSTPPSSRLNHNNNNNSSSSSCNSNKMYASSTQNISRLLEGWMRSSSPTKNATNNINVASGSHEKFTHGGGLISEEIESILSFDNLSHWDHCKYNSSSDKGSDEAAATDDDDMKLSGDHDIVRGDHNIVIHSNINDPPNPPLSAIEKWLLDETSNGQVEEMMALSPGF